MTAIPSGTRVEYDYAIEVSGKVAAVGGRMIRSAADIVIGRFFERLGPQPRSGRRHAAVVAPVVAGFGIAAMKPKKFAYCRPDSLDEALALLAQHGDAARVLAGGQSLVPMLNLRLVEAAVIVDISRLAALDAIGWSTARSRSARR